MVKVTLWLTDWPTSSVIPCCLEVLNPAASTVSVYVDAGSRANEKFPSASVLKMRVIPFSGLLRVTLAFGTRAPDESEIEPENEAVEARVWPCATGTSALINEAATVRKKNRERLRNLGIDWDPLLV
jgi:hypothetical protein